ncbi:hypothetical protein [Brevundimonas sp. UBA7534]|uniref:hypothetical protein n=1 Tax=Brevundimonas sp. UBA7534 TaxID=1946138 RepID=UPI0025C3818C|nr:hypothetical protein [Brevundimonas sp. UBA7534]
MAALLASFLALFVLVSAADAFACAPETGSLQGLAASDDLGDHRRQTVAEEDVEPFVDEVVAGFEDAKAHRRDPQKARS